MSRSARPLPAHLRYRAGPQARKVTLVTWFSAACAAAASAWGLDLGRTWGLSPADGGLLKPLWQRAAMGGGLALAGWAFLAGMLVYLRFYVTSLDVDAEGRTVRVGRLFPYPALALPGARVRLGAEVHTGDLGLPLVRLEAVDAPWCSLHVEGWRWPLLVDLRGRFGPPA